MNTFNQCIDDGNKFTARIRLQDRTVVADTGDVVTGSAIKRSGAQVGGQKF